MSVEQVRVRAGGEASPPPAAPEAAPATDALAAATAADADGGEAALGAHQAAWYLELIEMVALCGVALLCLWLAYDCWVIAGYYQRRWRLRPPAALGRTRRWWPWWPGGGSHVTFAE